MLTYYRVEAAHRRGADIAFTLSNGDVLTLPGEWNDLANLWMEGSLCGRRTETGGAVVLPIRVVEQAAKLGTDVRVS